MISIIFDYFLNIELYDHTSVEPNQFEQWAWSSFPNSLLLCLFQCARNPPPFPFVYNVEKIEKVYENDIEKSE
jgi:hypothetical protein